MAMNSTVRGVWREVVTVQCVVCEVWCVGFIGHFVRCFKVGCAALDVAV